LGRIQSRLRSRVGQACSRYFNERKIIELHDKCVTQQAIACTLKINQSTVCRTISEYIKSDFIVGHKPGGGRKRITTCRG